MTETLVGEDDHNITIPRDEYESLLSDKRFLEALLASGAEVKTTESTDGEPIDGELTELAQRYYNANLADEDGDAVVTDVLLLLEVSRGAEFLPRCVAVHNDLPTHRARGLLTETLSRLDTGDLMDGFSGVGCDDGPGESA